jgi:hypothetical protein
VALLVTDSAQHGIFCNLELDMEAIIGSAYPGFGFGGLLAPTSFGEFCRGVVLNFGF